MPRGGKREGAGRPTDEARVMVSMRLPPATFERMKEQAAKRGVSQADVVALAVGRLR